MECCNDVIIDKNKLSSAHNISNTTKFKKKKTHTHTQSINPHNNKPKWLLLKVSSSTHGIVTFILQKLQRSS